MSEDVKASPSEGATDPFAASLALAGASRGEADAFLRDQRQHMHEQLKQIHLDIMEKWLGVFLRAATAVVGTAMAAAVAWLVWQAAHSNGLRIEPFSVPPDMAARGLTGEVMATKLLDRLVTMQKQTNSARPARSYANAWGEHGIKLEIPETGISLSELDSWLREKLGHDSRISGEVVRSDKGVTLTARTDDGSAPGASGSEQDIDALTDKLAEQIYGATQPFRYAAYLSDKGRREEALAIFRRLALTGDHEDSVWAYGRWGSTTAYLYGWSAGMPILRKAVAVEPANIGAYDQLAIGHGTKGQSELALRDYQLQLAQLQDGRQTYVTPADMSFRTRFAKEQIDWRLGGYSDTLAILAELSRKPYPGFGRAVGPVFSGISHFGMHDAASARENLEDAHNMGTLVNGSTDLDYAVQASRVRQDWATMLAQVTQYQAFLQKTPHSNPIISTVITPLLAEPLAHLGRFAEAERAIAPTAGDCYPCLLRRALIAELQHQPARADFWLARAVAQGPSLPFAEEQWGRAWLSRGKPDAAIAQFTIANKKSPHFADAIEGWGEALMAKNQSHLALAKFAEADKYAPNWGRLHLKWGEALYYAGKRDDAKAQFARAATLDLTPSERSELARHP